MQLFRAVYILTCGLLMPVLSLAQTSTSGMEEVADKFLIQELQARYALAHDLTDPDLYAAVFTEDGELYGTKGLLARGRNALHAMTVSDRKRFNKDAAEGERSFGLMRHVITNSVIDISTDSTASGICYVLVIVNQDGVGPQILGTARYEDEYKKIEGEWLIARRQIVMDMNNPELGKSIGL